MKKLERFFALSLCLLLVLGTSFSIIGCEEDSESDTSNVSYEPEVRDGESDTNGDLVVNMENYSIEIHIVNESGDPVAGVDVTAFQGDGVLVLWALGDGFYSYLNIIELTGQETLTVQVNLLPTEGFVLEHNGNLNGLAALYADASVTEHCLEGTLSDLLFFINDTFSGFPFVFFSMDGTVAALSGQSQVDMYLMMGGMNQAIFDELMFSQGSLIPEDVVSYCWYTIEVDGASHMLPMVHLDHMVSQATPYDYKFIVTWGENPRDLDSHLFTPFESPADHVYYGWDGSAGEPPYAWLDVDDVSSYGPEAITIEERHPGTYTYAIYEFSGDGTLSNSEAHVEVFDGRFLIGEYDIPMDVEAGENWWWTVGTIDGDTGAWTVVNQVAAEPVMPAMQPAADMDMPLK